jgi:hypothetical protein
MRRRRVPGQALKIAKLNIDENPQTPPKFGIRGIPTLILFKNGTVEAQKVGALSKSQLAPSWTATCETAAIWAIRAATGQGSPAGRWWRHGIVATATGWRRRRGGNANGNVGRHATRSTIQSRSILPLTVRSSARPSSNRPVATR